MVLGRLAPKDRAAWMARARFQPEEQALFRIYPKNSLASRGVVVAASVGVKFVGAWPAVGDLVGKRRGGCLAARPGGNLGTDSARQGGMGSTGLAAVGEGCSRPRAGSVCCSMAIQ
jgi:hypothetical protein